jgi:RNA polymerase sigma factor (sigma-70 family)
MASDDEFLRVTLPALDLVHNLARRFAGDRADAEDLVQDTYLRAWQAWTAGNRPRRAERWLATICLNLGRDRLRRVALGSELAVEPAREPAAEVDVEAAAIDRVERAQIERARR